MSRISIGMDQDQITHGFLPSSCSPRLVNYYASKIHNYLAENDFPTYVSGVESMFPGIVDLITDDNLNFAKSILSAQVIQLMNVELHYMPSGSEPIPLHQDNFYHCVEDGAGLKFMIPFSELSVNNGGLFFFNCNSSIGVLPHSPSSVINFSSYIEDEVINGLPFDSNSYTYNVGDMSFHLLNSIHYSCGNKEKPVSFLVFRYQPENCTISLKMQANYSECINQHQKLIG